MYLKNLKGEEINTREKAIQSLIHTANHEQVPIHDLWCFKEQCELFNIDPTKFYKQDMCDECSEWGVEIYHYKDENFEYRYELWTHC